MTKGIFTSVNGLNFRHRTFIRNIKILLPTTWTLTTAENSVSEQFDDAEFKILPENPVYGDNPYTIQVKQIFSRISILDPIFRQVIVESPESSPI